jgi:hypothetical protein
MTAPTLDHVGVVAHDLPALAAAYERLGFTLTPQARYADGRIGNRCVMLRGSYVELLAVVDPNARSVTLERFLARYAGVHILAFGMADEQSAMERLHRAGIQQATLSRFMRPLDDEDPSGRTAEFVVVQTPDQPEGRFNLVHHLTPDLLWQGVFMQHPNNAIVLQDVWITVADPADAAARLSRLVGCVVVPDPMGGLALNLASGRIRLLPAMSGIVPRVTKLALRTSDSNAVIKRLVNERSIAACDSGGAVVIDAAAAGGVELCFNP